MIKILYHGSNIVVKEPLVSSSRKNLDFGPGFYTISDFNQAVSWAKRKSKIENSKEAFVSCYELDTEKLNVLNINQLNIPNKLWLDYVAKNRRGKFENIDYDLVIGPVANDDTFPTILLYIDGYIDADNAIKQLLPQKLKEQYTFKIKDSLTLLKFKKAVAV